MADVSDSEGGSYPGGSTLPAPALYIEFVRDNGKEGDSKSAGAARGEEGGEVSYGMNYGDFDYEYDDARYFESPSRQNPLYM
mmetsp:Transcript_18120/g.46397  ORF Transcript_18120/g.46397 Transcript_18120/m.46397 type:complete len:82 (+) Transcript_18120:415-660(+)